MARHHKSHKMHYSHSAERGSSSVTYRDDSPMRHDPRRDEEQMGYNMIHEDHSRIANLPEHVIMREYPKSRGFMPILGEEDHALERQLGMDEREADGQIKPRKA